MRRLPVIQQTDTDDALAASRPRWHWTFIGAGFIVTIWAPLAVLATPLGLRLVHVVAGAASLTGGGPPPAWLGPLSALPVIAAFAGAAWLGGALVGRFGGRAARREASLAAIVAALAVSLLASLVGQKLPFFAAFLAFVVFAAAGASFGALGAGFGLGRRPVLGSKAR